MPSSLRIALVGDYSPEVTAHRAIPEALRLSSESLGTPLHYDWIHTTTLGTDATGPLARYDAIWLVPNSPYANTAGALSAIRLARESRRPFLGTCAGFQHAILEYAGSVWQLEPSKAAHAELDPDAEDPVIAPLACSLVEEQGRVRFAPASRLSQLYGNEHAIEGYHCNFGLNLHYAERLNDGALRATAWDDAGEVRGVELTDHPFFVATLFQPERSALAGRVPPVVRGLVEAIGR
ncbi:MAG TPA: gamma-glutamyl-gamma-aminobutyrate hydrolase family protein [Gemmatimonadales bacterium]|nr:gamma-glutamyl-gamma-aminobutyrate hydrolase family protein [Gemmatimonadales bacterium]